MGTANKKAQTSSKRSSATSVKSPATSSSWPLGLKVAGGIVGGFLAFVVLFLALLFSFPDKVPAQLPDTVDYVAQSKLIHKLVRELSREEIREEAKLRLKPREIASLLKVADVMNILTILGVKSDYPLRYYRLQARERAVDFVFPLDTKMRWLFGGVIHFTGSVEPEKEGKELYVHFRKLKMGAFSIPTVFADRLAQKELTRWKDSQDFERFDRVVKSVFFAKDSEKLTVIYHPAALQRVFR